MKILLSPAKTLKLNTHDKFHGSTAHFNSFANVFWNEVTKFNCNELINYYQISENTANKLLTTFTSTKTGHAFYSYDGLVFKQITPTNKTLNFHYINNNFLILDALWGVLKPTDQIWNYRLDFNIKNKKHLRLLKEQWTTNYPLYFNCKEIYLNLASKEYTNYLKKTNIKLIDVTFLNYNKNNKLVQNATKSKIARGMLANYLIENNIQNISLVKQFNINYIFCKNLSCENNYVFVEQ